MRKFSVSLAVLLGIMVITSLSTAQMRVGDVAEEETVDSDVLATDENEVDQPSLEEAVAAACRRSATAGSHDCTVSSTAGWQQTPLSLQQGDQFKISYVYGAWTVDHRFLKYVNPAGYPPQIDRTIFQGCKTVSNLAYGTLLGKIGNGPIFFAGNKGTDEGGFRAQASGPLYLRINDNEACHADNDGQMTVTVGATVRKLNRPAGSQWHRCKLQEGCTFALNHGNTQLIIRILEELTAPQFYPELLQQCRAFFPLTTWECPLFAAELQILGLVTAHQLQLNDLGRGVFIYATYGRPPGIIPQ